jgi:hypothetical protein
MPTRKEEKLYLIQIFKDDVSIKDTLRIFVHLSTNMESHIVTEIFCLITSSKKELDGKSTSVNVSKR